MLAPQILSRGVPGGDALQHGRMRRVLQDPMCGVLLQVQQSARTGPPKSTGRRIPMRTNELNHEVNSRSTDSTDFRDDGVEHRSDGRTNNRNRRQPPLTGSSLGPGGGGDTGGNSHLGQTRLAHSLRHPNTYSATSGNILPL